MPFCQFGVTTLPIPQPTMLRRRILVVDDDELVRNVLRLALQRSGFDVALAADGWEAVDLFSRDGANISAVLLDICMPGLDGLQTLERLHRISPETPVYFMTAGSVACAEPELVGLGAVQVFAKPFDLDEITRTLQK